MLRGRVVLFGILAVAACDDTAGIEGVAGDLVLAPDVLDFGDVPVGAVSVLQVRLRAKTVDIAIADVTVEGDAFLLPNAAPALADATERTIDIVFAPTDATDYSGRLVVKGIDTVEDEYAIAVRGRGVRGALELVDEGASCSRGGVSFGVVPRFETATRSFAVEATGNQPAEIVGVSLESGTTREMSIVSPRAQRHTLLPGERLPIEMVYVPSNNGADQGALRIDLADGGAFSVPLCGAGNAVTICVTPNPVEIGRVGVQETRTTTFRISSCGDEPLEVSAIVDVDDAAHPSDAGFGFTVPPDLTRPLATGEGLDVEVSFSPLVEEAASAWLRITSNDLVSPEFFVQLRGEGVPPCELAIAPERLHFSAVPVGTNRVRRALLVNDNRVDCRVVRQTIVGPSAAAFSLTDTSTSVVLASGEALLVPVRYASLGTGQVEEATLEVETDGGYVTTVALRGTSYLEPGCQLEVQPSAVSFGATAVLSETPRGVSIRNLSTVPCQVLSGTWRPGSSAAFRPVSGLPRTIGPNGSFELAITFQPMSAGPHAGTLRLETTDQDDLQIDVATYGLAKQPLICVSPTDIDFGASSGVALRAVNVSACGGEDLTITALAFAAPLDSELTLQRVGAMPWRIPAGQAVTFDVRYESNDPFADWGTVQIVSNDPLSPTVGITVRGGPDEFPPEVGANLYVWQIGTVMRYPLQGGQAGGPFYGQLASPPRGCSGCHAVSPDGRYVALVEYPRFVLVDTMTNTEVPTGVGGSVESISWNPDVNTTPPYQFVYADGSGPLQKGAVGGPLGAVGGTTDGNVYRMPSWGPNGAIVAARAPSAAANVAFGFTGPVDLVLVPEQGGPPTAVAGASSNGSAQYYPAWSPTGDWIAFTFSPTAVTTYAAADAEVRLVRADQSGFVSPLPLANGAGASSYPTWSLDGRILSFSSNRVGGLGDWDIYGALVDNLTGSSGQALPIQNVNTPAFDHLAVWSR